MKKKLIPFIFTLAIFAVAAPQTAYAAKGNATHSSSVKSGAASYSGTASQAGASVTSGTSSRSAASSKSGTAGQTGITAENAFSDADAVTAAGDMFTDGTQEGDISALANELVKKTEEEARKYKKEQEAARKAVEEKEARRKAEEAKKKAEEEKKKAEEEARIAAQKAEEERLASRQKIVDFALQFEGNPYVYGGTSLTNGADCSGFVMSVFQEFGYELPRVAAAQCDASAKKDVKDIEPGDLVFYGDYGIDHVALYIGDGQIIHASTAATGIKISDYDYRQPIFVGTYVD